MAVNGERRELIEGRLGDAEVEAPDQAHEQHAEVVRGDVTADGGAAGQRGSRVGLVDRRWHCA